MMYLSSHASTFKDFSSQCFNLNFVQQIFHLIASIDYIATLHTVDKGAFGYGSYSLAMMDRHYHSGMTEILVEVKWNRPAAAGVFGSQPPQLTTLIKLKWCLWIYC
ncbi:hypothetical protein V6N11_060957 [Hibiscus sabdariffa]|uniref:Uncharacterized protein n=1 Tax=Hibiscus sabdariffa TaxID=183260 RepID=A0ABR2QRU8_9ROSI